MNGLTLPGLLDALSKASIVSYADQFGKIVFVNDNFIETSGYSRAELMGQDHRLLSSGYHPKSFWKEVWQTIRRGEVWRGEVLNKGKYANLYWVDTFIYPFKDNEGNLAGFLSIRNDITKRKTYELELERKNELLERIAWTQAHEIRGPVATISGLISVFDRECNDRNLNQQILSHLETTVSLLDTRVRSIVDLTQEIDIETALVKENKAA